MILIPVKSLATAKQRLSPLLTGEERRALAEAMLEDVLAAVAAGRERCAMAVAVVTGDAHAAARALKLGFETIEDPQDAGETAAIERATRACEQSGIGVTLVIPADIPLITPDELATVVSAAPREGVAIVPSTDMRGSNAVLRRPASIIPLRFGDDSLLPHLRAARTTGKQYIVLSLPGIGLDVDRPDDLAALMLAPGSTRSQKLLRSPEWSLPGRLLAAGILTAEQADALR